MKNIEIMTCNDGINGGGFYEIHNINCLQNIDHLIFMIDGIILGNLKYNCRDSILKEVIVRLEDQDDVDYINDYYKSNRVFSDILIRAEIKEDF